MDALPQLNLPRDPEVEDWGAIKAWAQAQVEPARARVEAARGVLQRTGSANARASLGHAVSVYRATWRRALVLRAMGMNSDRAREVATMRLELADWHPRGGAKVRIAGKAAPRPPGAAVGPPTPRWREDTWTPEFAAEVRAWLEDACDGEVPRQGWLWNPLGDRALSRVTVWRYVQQAATGAGVQARLPEGSGRRYLWSAKVAREVTGRGARMRGEPLTLGAKIEGHGVRTIQESYDRYTDHERMQAARLRDSL